MDDQPEKIEKLALAASELFDVQIEKNCALLTIRHYNEQIIQQLTEGREQLLSQKTKETIQVLLKSLSTNGND
jgi:aspartate kinase